MSTELTQTNRYQELLATNGLTQNIKHFEGLYTQIAVSESGYIAIYHPYEPAVKGGFLKGEGSPERPEWLEVLHISQINDFDIDVDGVEKTKVKGGFGGALVGGLLGGATGAIIGSTATSGKVKTSTTINAIDLIISTKDFNNPLVKVRLFQPFLAFTGGGEALRYSMPSMLRPYYNGNVLGFSFNKEGKRLYKEVFNSGELNYSLIEQLQTTLNQMLTAQQSVPQTVVQQASSADELAKFKSLLDSGVISQEEFDAKKRQLLGL